MRCDDLFLLKDVPSCSNIGYEKVFKSEIKISFNSN